MVDVTEQILNPTGEYDDWNASPEQFLAEVNRRVAEFIRDAEDLVSYCSPKDKNAFTYASVHAKYGILGYVESGLWLEKLKRYWWLYKRKFKNFNDCCQQLIGRGSWYANALIKAAKVCMALIDRGFDILPMCESQARPLTRYIKDDAHLTGESYDEELIAKWAEVVQTAPAKGITATHVQFIVNGEPEEETKRIKIKRSTYEKLQKLAIEKDVSVDELIAQEINQIVFFQRLHCWL